MFGFGSSFGSGGFRRLRGLVPQPNVYAGYGRNMAHLDAFVASMDSGTPKRIVLYGDSISEGGNSTDFLVDSFSARIKSGLQTRHGNAGVGMVTARRRKNVVPEYVWTRTGIAFETTYATRFDHGGTAQLSFDGTGITIYFIGGNAEFLVQMDGGTATRVPLTGLNNAVQTHTVDGLTAGNHTLLVTVDEVGKVLNLCGAVPDSGTGIRLDNIAQWGARALQNGDTLNRKLADALDPDLTMIALMANDFGNQTPIATYKTNLSAIITDALASNSAVLILNNGLRPNTFGSINLADYEQAAREVADANGVALIEVDTFMGTPMEAEAKGYYSVDTTHPTDAGHEAISSLVLNYLAPA